MRLAISNIAWDAAEDEAVAALLRRHGVDAVDLAAPKYFADAAAAGTADILAVRRWWEARGFEITGMQSLLFGTQGLNLFGPPAVQQAMLDHLRHICRIGGLWGARRLVFGSPRNRDRAGLDDAQVLQAGTQFFRRLGDVAAAEGVLICLEPNPPCYGANYMTTSDETAQVVAAVDHPAVRMQCDTGAMALQQEEPQQVLARHAGRVGHVHLSEPELRPLGDVPATTALHGAAHQALQQHLPGAVGRLAMLATRGEPHRHSLERAVQA
ncbi:MAG: sugar phosphate isomerase/epimerase family protein, partial [Aquincola tertiaricarbonis]